MRRPISATAGNRNPPANASGNALSFKWLPGQRQGSAIATDSTRRSIDCTIECLSCAQITILVYRDYGAEKETLFQYPRSNRAEHHQLPLLGAGRATDTGASTTMSRASL